MNDSPTVSSGALAALGGVELAPGRYGIYHEPHKLWYSTDSAGVLFPHYLTLGEAILQRPNLYVALPRWFTPESPFGYRTTHGDLIPLSRIVHNVNDITCAEGGHRWAPLIEWQNDPGLAAGAVCPGCFQIEDDLHAGHVVAIDYLTGLEIPAKHEGD